MKELIYRQQVIIKAPLSRVWQALTNPKITPHYMFGCATRSDWKVGSKLDWVGTHDNQVYVTGTIIEIEPEKVLSYTTINPFAKQPDKHPLVARYDLSEDGDTTILNISQGDFSLLDNADVRYEESVQSWQTTMSLMKAWIEH